jgi:hypothetical protein
MQWVHLRKSSRQIRILRRRCSRLQRSVTELRQAAQVQPAAPLQEQAAQATPVQEEPAQPAAEQQEEAFRPVPTEDSQAAAGLEESLQPARPSAGQVCTFDEVGRSETLAQEAVMLLPVLLTHLLSSMQAVDKCCRCC